MSPELRDLLHTPDAWALPPDLHSCWQARGLYSPLQFVLGLRPDLHRALSGIDSGWAVTGDLSQEQIFAASTYLHETIHWWQHVGSTAGLCLSMLYPAQAHLNHKYLLALLESIGPVKSIREFNISHAKQRDDETPADRDINVVLNNWHDFEFYRYFVTDPAKVSNITQDPYYESQAHSYDVAISAVIWLLSSSLDPGLKILPDPREWEDEARLLRTSMVTGFHYGSPVHIPPVGARQIFEGQARFCQLQYLNRLSDHSYDFEEFNNDGLLQGVYVEAFASFLELTECEWPRSVSGGEVALFLLICDMAINASEGLFDRPAPLERLIEKHDPGYRFTLLCIAARQAFQELCTDAGTFSAEGYRRAVSRLCELTGYASPIRLSERFVEWAASHPPLMQILKEDRTFRFSLQNLPVRVFVARFARLQIDKLSSPEFFCWPGYWMVGSHASDEEANVLRLFEEHRALFVDKEDGDVYPRTFETRDEEAVQQTFNTFYSWVALYDLTRQWLVTPGEFSFNFGWLTTKFSQNEVREWVSQGFHETFGVRPEQFTIATRGKT